MLPNIVFFEGEDTTETASLWETNGTASGTFELTDVASPPPLIIGEANFGFVPSTQVSIDLTVFKTRCCSPVEFSPTTPLTSALIRCGRPTARLVALFHFR